MAAASMLGMLLLAMLVLVPIVLGVAMLINSRRGGLGYPACGQCKYNLSASIGKTDRCPECGSAFATAGILPPRGPRRRLMAWTGGNEQQIWTPSGLAFDDQGALYVSDRQSRTVQRFVLPTFQP